MTAGTPDEAEVIREAVAEVTEAEEPLREALDDARDADLYRLSQAEALLREAGFAPDEHGRWHPTDDRSEPGQAGPDS